MISTETLRYLLAVLSSETLTIPAVAAGVHVQAAQEIHGALKERQEQQGGQSQHQEADEGRQESSAGDSNSPTPIRTG